MSCFGKAPQLRQRRERLRDADILTLLRRVLEEPDVMAEALAEPERRERCSLH
jgi:hypothetical protein